MRVTGIEPKFTKEDVQKKYRELLTAKSKGELNLEDFKKLEGLTGIEPKFTKEDVQKKYRELLAKDNLKEMEKLMDISQIKPSRKTINIAYSRFIIINNFASLKSLMDITGTSPNEKIVQQAYKKHLSEDELTNMGILKRSTKIEPNINEKEIQAAYVRILDKKNHYDLSDLENICGVKPNAEIIQDHYSNLAKEGQFKSIKDLHQRSGFEPSQKVWEMLVKNLMDR